MFPDNGLMYCKLSRIHNQLFRFAILPIYQPVYEIICLFLLRCLFIYSNRETLSVLVHKLIKPFKIMFDFSIAKIFHTLLNFNLHCGFGFLQGAVKRMAIGNALTAINQ